MTIKDYEEVVEAIEQHSFLLPSGEEKHAEVTNPRLDGHPPDFLRVEIARKGMTFNLIQLAEQYDLKVGDVWQHNEEKENDTLMLKFVPKEDKNATEDSESSS